MAQERLIPKQVVNFTSPSPMGEDHDCDECTHWYQGKCLLVEGANDPEAWCTMFSQAPSLGSSYESENE